jgi:quinol monooxygenase YgiN
MGGILRVPRAPGLSAASGVNCSHRRKKDTEMLSITAIIQVKKGCEQAMQDGLREVGENARINEPDTIDFFVSQDSADPCVFTTYERFTDQAAMDRHNNSDTVARFFGVAKSLLDGEAKLIYSREQFSKS